MTTEPTTIREPSTCVAPKTSGHDPTLCGAPATEEREVEGLTVRLCATCASRLDEEIADFLGVQAPKVVARG